MNTLKEIGECVLIIMIAPFALCMVIVFFVLIALGERNLNQ